MPEEKKVFVERLCDFYCTNVNPQFGIESMEYTKEGPEEFVYVSFRSGSYKRFCVTADSNQGIFKDFVKFLNDFDSYSWLY